MLPVIHHSHFCTAEHQPLPPGSFYFYPCVNLCTLKTFSIQQHNSPPNSSPLGKSGSITLTHPFSVPTVFMFCPLPFAYNHLLPLLLCRISQLWGKHRFLFCLGSVWPVGMKCRLGPNLKVLENRTTQRSACPAQALAAALCTGCPAVPSTEAETPAPCQSPRSSFLQDSSPLLPAPSWQNCKVHFFPLLLVGSVQGQPSVIQCGILLFAVPQFLGTAFSHPVVLSTQGLIKQNRQTGKVLPFALEKPHHGDLPAQQKTQAQQVSASLSVSGRMNLGAVCFLHTCEQQSERFCQQSAGGWSAAAAGLSSDPRWL